MLRRSALVVVFVLALAAAGTALYRWVGVGYTSPGPARDVVRVEIASGSSIRSVLQLLGERGVLENPERVKLYLRLHGRSPRLKAGTYDFPARASPAQVLTLLEQGAVVLEQLTVVEGSTFSDFRHALEHHPAVVAIFAGKSDAELMKAIGHAGEHPEGRFFPDTYRFAAHTSEADILKLAYGSLERVLTDAWREHRPDSTISTPYEALTLASIVEKETGLPAERARIAGVFAARLRQGMRLQSDPTVIYGLGASYDGDIHTRDLTTDTPYNTYTRAGLPPTPVALPGRESILAAVHPEDTGALYFVAVGDGSGAHYFSKTLEEHNEAVRRYLARLRSQQPSITHTTTVAGKK